jgi:hypothetical protein
MTDIRCSLKERKQKHTPLTPLYRGELEVELEGFF